MGCRSRLHSLDPENELGRFTLSLTCYCLVWVLLFLSCYYLCLPRQDEQVQTSQARDRWTAQQMQVWSKAWTHRNSSKAAEGQQAGVAEH